MILTVKKITLWDNEIIVIFNTIMVCWKIHYFKKYYKRLSYSIAIYMLLKILTHELK